jgi:hypothetical protein
LYPEAVKEWGSVINRFDSLEKESEGEGLDAPDVPADQVEESLAAWLDEIELEDGEHGAHRHSDRCGHGKVDIENVTLYQCSWCTNPSAALKRCTGCGKARFVIYLRGRGVCYNLCCWETDIAMLHVKSCIGLTIKNSATLTLLIDGTVGIANVVQYVTSFDDEKL